MLQILYSLSWKEGRALFLLYLSHLILILLKSLKIQRNRANSPAFLRENAREGFTLPEICNFDFLLILAPVVTPLGPLQVIAVSCLHRRPGPSTPSVWRKANYIPQEIYRHLT